MTTAKNNVFYLVEGGGIEFWWGGSKPPSPSIRENHELCGSKLSGLHLFDNMAIIH